MKLPSHDLLCDIVFTPLALISPVPWANPGPAQADNDRLQWFNDTLFVTPLLYTLLHFTPLTSSAWP